MPSRGSSPDETIFIAKYESGTSIFTQHSALSTQHFQVSQSREKPTTKHESMIFSQMVLQIEVVVH
ncbi:hypothetical protein H6G27_23395 [Nostoc linckia FACHB-104]|nr:hypothetical protein [Nostoc linckia FACHB-104]